MTNLFALTVSAGALVLAQAAQPPTAQPTPPAPAAAPAPANTPAATAPLPPRTATVDRTAQLPLTRDATGEAVFVTQVLLDRAGFSPGVIDGRYGDHMVSATSAFQEAKGLPVTGDIDAATLAALQTDTAPPLMRLTVTTSADVSGAPLPKKPEQQAKLKSLSYSSAAEAIAEKYHTTPEALAELNPGAEIKPGATLLVPNVQSVMDRALDAAIGGPLTTPNPEADKKWAATLEDSAVARTQTAATSLVVDKSAKTVRAFDQSNRLIAQFPATIGSTDMPSPEGAYTVQAVAHNPTYNYDSKVLEEPGNKKFKLPPGPNSPVGVVWIDLSKENVGIHGAAEPSHIGRTESHGCVRLTNWDAARLAQMVTKGVTVTFQE